MYKVNDKGIEKTTVWDLVDWLESKDTVGLDIESEGLIYLRDRITTVTVGDYDTQFVMQMNALDHYDFIMVVCDLAKKTVVGHNLLFDLSFIQYWFKCRVGMWNVFDVFQNECILTKGMNSSKSYASLTEMYCSVSIDKSQQTSFKYEQTLTEEQVLYCANDVKYLMPIKEAQETYIAEYISKGFGTEELYRIERELTPKLADIQVGGCEYDVELHKENTRKIANLVERDVYYMLSFLRKIFSTYELNKVKYSKDFSVETKKDLGLINFNSPTQLLALIHAMDSTVSNTREITLNLYLQTGSNEDLKEFIRLLIQHRHRNKMLSTYGNTFLSAVVKEGERYIIRTNLQQNMTTTSRLISSDVNDKKGNKNGKNFVNMQNFPKDPNYRACITARKGYVLSFMDFEGAELRILASQSGDPLLLDGVTGKTDLHSILASQSLRIITGDEKVTVSKRQNSKFRSLHKRVLFGIIYGAEVDLIRKILNVDRKIALKVFKSITQQISTAFNFLTECANTAMKLNVGIANLVTRRFIFLEELEQCKKMGVYYPATPKLRRQMFNLNMQATNADMMKACIIDVFNYFHQIKEYDCRILFTVYDELVFETPEGHPWIPEKVKEICINTCNKFLSRGVVMECNLTTGPNWAGIK